LLASPGTQPRIASRLARRGFRGTLPDDLDEAATFDRCPLTTTKTRHFRYTTLSERSARRGGWPGTLTSNFC